jgi:small subunit ribosomal protein S20
MPIIKSAKKALRSSARKHRYNLARQEAMKKAIKNLKIAVSEKNKKEIKPLLSLAYKAVDKAVKRGIVKKNTASRKKSQLSRLATQL